MNIESVRRGATDGFRAGLALQLGALLADLLSALLAAAGLGALLAHSRLTRLLLGLLGAALLLHLGRASLRDARATKDSVVPLSTDISARTFISRSRRETPATRSRC